jgi:hypothetical protein
MNKYNKKCNHQKIYLANNNMTIIKNFIKIINNWLKETKVNKIVNRLIKTKPIAYIGYNNAKIEQLFLGAV